MSEKQSQHRLRDLKRPSQNKHISGREEEKKKKKERRKRKRCASCGDDRPHEREASVWEVE